jgi:hypothetical protein
MVLPVTTMMPADTDAWLDLIRQHLDWYPRLQLPDIYKLLYQGVMGSEHMVATQQEFGRRLEIEFENQPSDVTHPVLEVIRPDHTLFRLNLRPYKAQHTTIQPLIPAMLATTKLVTGTLDELRAVWSDFVINCQQEKMASFSPSQLDEFTGWLEQQGYSALHHSEVYTKEYQPAYRLISSKFTAELGLEDES